MDNMNDKNDVKNINDMENMNDMNENTNNDMSDNTSNNISKLRHLQQKADEYLVINPSVLQILLQLEQNALRLNRTALRASNTCGCIRLGSEKLLLPEGATWEEMRQQPTGDVLAGICPECRNDMQDKLGALLFYAAALCNAFDLDLDEITEREIQKLDLLGYFMLL